MEGGTINQTGKKNSNGAVRPLFHPALNDITVEGLLYALSDPVRAQIYAEMATSECPLNCSNFRKVDNRTLPKATLSQHFKILREAGLIRSERKGIQMHNTTRCAELKETNPPGNRFFHPSPSSTPAR